MAEPNLGVAHRRHHAPLWQASRSRREAIPGCANQTPPPADCKANEGVETGSRDPGEKHRGSYCVIGQIIFVRTLFDPPATVKLRKVARRAPRRCDDRTGGGARQEMFLNRIARAPRGEMIVGAPPGAPPLPREGDAPGARPALAHTPAGRGSPACPASRPTSGHARRSGYWAAYPPSTKRMAPVMKSASSEAKYTAAGAISSTRPSRPMG